MVNPINTGSLALPTDLVQIDLPSPVLRQAVSVTPAGQAADSGTATSGQAHGQPRNDTAVLDRTLEQINESMRAWATGMRFDVDEDAQRVVVSIVDSQTGEVLRTVPSDAVLRVAKMIVQLQGATIRTQA